MTELKSAMKTDESNDSVRMIFNRVCRRFFQATGMHGVVGAVDCSHISILRPNVHEEHYVNRKSYHSTNMQAVCDYDMRFLNINARYPGSTGDGFIWRNSRVKLELERRYGAGERGEWIIEDSGYGNEPWLLLPILHADEGSPEAHYTQVHCRTRCCLLRHRTLHYDPHKAALIINACAVLHNIALHARLPPPEPLTAQEEEDEILGEAGDLEPNPIDIERDFLGHARAVRARVVARLWAQRR